MGQDTFSNPVADGYFADPFILPAGDEAACRLHLARTICRRAERRIVAFAMDRPVSNLIVGYLNRLSDWLFVMARLANLRAGVEDVPWEK